MMFLIAVIAALEASLFILYESSKYHTVTHYGQVQDIFYTAGKRHIFVLVSGKSMAIRECDGCYTLLGSAVSVCSLYYGDEVVEIAYTCDFSIYSRLAADLGWLLVATTWSLAFVTMAFMGKKEKKED